MAQVMKHVGVYGGKPCVVVFRELPDDAEHALIISSNSLDGQFHDDVMSVIDSAEAQEAQEISEVLHRRRLTDGENMLEALHSRGKLQRVPVEMVSLTPVPNQQVPLADINAEIRKIKNESNPPLITETDTTARQQADVPATDGSDPEAIASNLLTQANLLEADAKALVADADAKRQEAYRLNPELRPKKGPGRPPKATLDSI